MIAKTDLEKVQYHMLKIMETGYNPVELMAQWVASYIAGSEMSMSDFVCDDLRQTIDRIDELLQDQNKIWVRLMPGGSSGDPLLSNEEAMVADIAHILTKDREIEGDALAWMAIGEIEAILAKNGIINFRLMSTQEAFLASFKGEYRGRSGWFLYQANTGWWFWDDDLVIFTNIEDPDADGLTPGDTILVPIRDVFQITDQSELAKAMASRKV